MSDPQFLQFIYYSSIPWIPFQLFIYIYSLGLFLWMQCIIPCCDGWQVSVIWLCQKPRAARRTNRSRYASARTRKTPNAETWAALHLLTAWGWPFRASMPTLMHPACRPSRPARLTSSRLTLGMFICPSSKPSFRLQSLFRDLNLGDLTKRMISVLLTLMKHQ